MARGRIVTDIESVKVKLNELRKKKSVTARELLPLLEMLVSVVEGEPTVYANNHVKGDLEEMAREMKRKRA